MGSSITSLSAGVVAAALAASWMPTASAAGWDFEAGVTGKETYSDNVGLSPNDAQSDFITEISPYISATKKGSRLEADFRYRIQNLIYVNDSGRNRTNQQLAARGKAEVYENELFLDGSASVYQQFTSLFGAVGNDPATSSDNLTDIYTATLSPYWQHRFSTFANLLARYRLAETRSSGSSLSNSTTNAIEAGLTSGTAFRDWNWGLNYADEEINYTNRTDVAFRSTSASLGYLFSPKFSVRGTYGYQHNNYLAGRSELTGYFWTANATWAPNVRTTITAGYGDYPYGNSPSFALTYRTRSWSVTGSYARTLTTTTSSADLSRTVDLGQINLGGITGQILGLDTTRITTNQVYTNERLQLAGHYTKGKSTVGVTLFRTRQENREATLQTSTLFSDAFAQGGNVIEQTGVNVNWSWRMTPVLTPNLRFNYVDISYPDIGRDDTLYYLGAGVDRRFNHQLTGRMEVRHQQRDSTASNGGYNENAIIGTVNYKF